MLLMLSVIPLCAQSGDTSESDEDRIVLTAFLPPELELPPGAATALQTKMSQLVTRYGLGGTALFPQFIITAKPTLLTKEILSTAPVKHVYVIDLALFIGDGIAGTLFASTSISLKGVGDTEEKAYLAALKMFNPQDARLQAFMQTGKEQIISYFNAQCGFIIASAKTLAAERKFDEALYTLLQVPDVSKTCFDTVQVERIAIFQQKLELECAQHIAAANALIAQDKWDEAAEKLGLFTPDMACYPEVSKLLEKITDHRCAVALGQANAAWATRDMERTAEALAQIPTDSKCAAQAKKRYTEISDKLDARERAAWNLAYEKYNRNQTLRENKAEHQMNMETKQAAHQINMETRQMDYQAKQGYELEKSRIRAMRDVGVAFAKNQPRKVTYRVRGW